MLLYIILDRGMHGIGRGGDDAIGLVIDPLAPLLRFCVDRRGVWSPSSTSALR